SGLQLSCRTARFPVSKQSSDELASRGVVVRENEDAVSICSGAVGGYGHCPCFHHQHGDGFRPRRNAQWEMAYISAVRGARIPCLVGGTRNPIPSIRALKAVTLEQCSAEPNSAVLDHRRMPSYCR